MGNCNTCKHKDKQNRCKVQGKAQIHNLNLECSLYKKPFLTNIVNLLKKEKKPIQLTENCKKPEEVKTITPEDIKNKIAGIKKITEEDIAAFLMKQDSKVLKLAKELLEKLIKLRNL